MKETGTQNRERSNDKRSSVVDKVLTTSFAQKSFLITLSENSAARFELLRRTNKKYDRRNQDLAD